MKHRNLPLSNILCPTQRLRTHFAVLLAFAAIVTLPESAVRALAAEAYRPSDDSEVLEKLPRTLLASTDQLTALRRQLSVEPNNTELAGDVASQYMRIGNQSGDPRYFGYARAAIQPWWEASSPAVSILRLRAKLKEKDHHYADALADLRKLLAKAPDDIQAWVEITNINRVLGQYEKSLAACEKLSKIAGPERTQLCRIPIQALTGEASEAYGALSALFSKAEEQYPTALQWVITMQAKLAVSLGLNDEAERHFQDGLERDATNTYLMREYADFLLDSERYAEVLSLLNDHTYDNGVLLRSAIAARRNGDHQLSEKWTRELEKRFEEIRLRGSQPHGRFETRYLLELRDNPAKALEVGLANWEKQKELRDTRNVLEAAVAADDSAAVASVLEFLMKHKTQNVAIQKLVQELKGAE